ncbi:psbP domain-containing protein 5 chloroplastic-like [Trifolium pratense]|uniref:PsbP domain-containing protein 5 chloroplastic-like n=1 Tax=Trifolium pratense TaxID=57577 RepID=A0A2K3NRS8_TRIPR|nr:psbP domain-containing protein 5, chloroplastic [Trifolium pratense]PNY05740.1 psbP domain-containing protein 5 chloroplastic-like [Trifolium pratense]
MVLQSLCLCPSNNSALILPNNNLIFRNNNNNSNNSTRLILNQNKSDQKRDFSTSCSSSIKPRRDLLLLGLTSLSLTCLPFSVTLAGEEEPKMASFLDETNAYSYLYPVELPSKNFVFKWVESRKPERYSSAAPLSPNARLRIVSERVDIFDNLIISVTIGPPSAGLINLKDKSKWTAKSVADSVLAEKSSLRVTSAQRSAESSVLDAHSDEIDGVPYWYYEYLIRKSPNTMSEESGIYRHYLASTAERDGYLYSISASTLSPQWKKMGPIFEKTVSSFRLVSPTENYVPPFKDPWRFW